MITIPATEDFTVAWPDPGMSEAPWVGDRMHFPGPTVQLAQHLVGGFQEQVLSAPTLFANGYQFSIPPTIPAVPDEVLREGLQIWHNSYAPRIRDLCTRIRTTDFDAMTGPELAASMERFAAEVLEGLRLTLVVVRQFMQPTFAMLQFLEENLGSDGPILAGMLLQGFKNATAASGAGIDHLAALAGKSPELARALKEGQGANFRSLKGGAEFESELATFLEEFGWRAEAWNTLHVPTWAEEPSALLALVGRYLTEAGTAPETAGKRSSDQRAAALADVEARLTDAQRATFRQLLEVALAHVAVSEDRARWQLSMIGTMRLPALALGRKLAAAGLLDQAKDVFHLSWDEAQRAATDPGAWVREAATAGRADFERWEHLVPPPFLGAIPDPAQMPPDMLPMARHFFGLGMPSITNGVIQGVGASRGTVVGRARVIRHLDESDRLEAGDILVCVTTAPPWTALFAIAGAVVTDTGGVMSHSGICAREFAIPCVVATQVGTHAIPDGATITVDGEAGTVTIM